ncbi:MAG: DUF1611 domain-containing protein [Proteobacteria bacterium]|nr:DUF1611 domain-containing protein [Pseudomonadota bacterium]
MINKAFTQIQLDPPFLLFVGDVKDDASAKTGFGIAQWRRSACAGQMRLPGCGVDLRLPELDISGAVAAGTKTAIVGVAPRGGMIPGHWLETLAGLARAGIDLAAGLHVRLANLPGLAAAAAAGGSVLIDCRVPPQGIPIATGRKRSGRRVLTVGTDCAVGKKYTALGLHMELANRGVAATFRATGQTGIMIAGRGIPIDAVVSDFVAGAAEVLSPDNDPAHWDVIEGQGALNHPSYAGVSLGLLHGSQPDALVLCHDAARTSIFGLEGFELSPIGKIIERNLDQARITNPAARCVGISVNTSSLPPDARHAWLQGLSRGIGLPCADPLIDGVAPIVDRLLASE